MAVLTESNELYKKVDPPVKYDEFSRNYNSYPVYSPHRNYREGCKPTQIQIINELVIDYETINPNFCKNFEESDETKERSEANDGFNYIHCHKWFVGENCKHLQKLIDEQMSGNNSDEIEITEYSYETYYQFIQYLYTDSIEAQNSVLAKHRPFAGIAIIG